MCKSEMCCFCNEKESIDHLFFDYVVAKVMWGFTSEFLGWEIGIDYFSASSKWIHKVKFGYVNVISSVVLRAI
jgi:E3 ubiquitin-protein ligase DOA10